MSIDLNSPDPIFQVFNPIDSSSLIESTEKTDERKIIFFFLQ